MTNHKYFKLLLITISLAIVILVLGFVALPADEPSFDNSISLVKPQFVNSAFASEGSPEALPIGEYLDQEAGISAYMLASFSIDLNDVRDTFTTVELETANYIIGSIDMPDYPEVYDPHIYVHTDGWILTYYLKGDPVSKIVDPKLQTIASTLLDDAISIIAGAAGVPVATTNFYDFRYPNATHMMFIAEAISNGNDFTVQLTSSYGYFERSWSLADFGQSDYFTVGGVDKTTDNPTYWNGGTGYGYIAASELLPDTTYTITVDDYGVLVLLYRVP